VGDGLIFNKASFIHHHLTTEVELNNSW